MVSGNNPAMTKSRTTDEQYFKEHQFDELQDGTRTLRAYPISTYTVSQVAVAEENHEEHSLNFVTENSSRKNDTVDVINRRSQSRGGLQNGIYSERRLNGLPADRLCEPNGSDTHFEARRNGRVSVSRVRFEESWEDTTTSKAEYKGGGDLAKANSSREDTGSNRSKYRLNVCDKSDVELKLTKGINSTTHNVKQWECQDRQKEVSMNSVSPVYDEPENKNDKKDDMTCRYNTTTVKREVYSKLNQGAPQIVPEVSRVDEPKPLGLRQLIKIHEVQIAEVARSAASMRRPTTGKIQEGRLVKVKAVPEIEAKQTHIKQHTGKVSLTGNKASFEESDGVTKPIRIIPSQTDNLNDSKRNQDSGENELLPNSDGTFNLSTTVVKPKRHTVEIMRTKPEVREEQKWKRHTAIGLVGVDPQEIRESLGVNAWSSTGKISEKIFAGDSDLESEHTNKQTVEPEKQVVNEKVKKCDVIDVNTSRRNEISELYMSSDKQKAALEYEHEQNDVPPERPPLPENFYSSAEDILERPPPPITDDTDIISAHMLQENVTPSNEIIKPSVSGKRQRGIPSSSSLPAVHAFPIGVDIQREEDNAVKSGNVELEKDVVFGNSRSNREMYEERLARINLVPLDVHQELCTNEDMVSSQCTSPESFAWRNNLYMEKNACSEKLKSYAKQLKLLIKEKEDLERKFELELRDWKRKYEEQQKVANAYQKLEDRYRRRVQELQGALMKCRCSNAEEIKTLLLGQLG